MPTCLVVDDSKIVRRLEKGIMEGFGFSVVEAGDGQQALDSCKQAMPALILLDWHMPVMTGIEFIRALRALPGGKSPKVIFCTTENELKNIMIALDEGADEYVMKPFDADIIRGKLEQVGLL